MKQPRIEKLAGINLVGKRRKMSFSKDKTRELWQEFMPRRKEIKNTIGSVLYSVEIYNDSSFFNHFNPDKEFEKWAAMRVINFEGVPNDMEMLQIPEGLYGVFLYRGKGSEAAKAYQNIFATWLPQSDFILDARPHLALMNEKYQNEDPNSEEELWIPIKQK